MARRKKKKKKKNTGERLIEGYGGSEQLFAPSGPARRGKKTPFPQTFAPSGDARGSGVGSYPQSFAPSGTAEEGREYTQQRHSPRLQIQGPTVSDINIRPSSLNLQDVGPSEDVQPWINLLLEQLTAEPESELDADLESTLEMLDPFLHAAEPQADSLPSYGGDGLDDSTILDSFLPVEAPAPRRKPSPFRRGKRVR